MSNEKQFVAHNRANGWRSKRTYSAGEVARMQNKPAYKAWTFIEVKPAPVPPTLTKVTKSPRTDAGHNNTTNTGAVVEPDRAAPGSDNNSDSN